MSEPSQPVVAERPDMIDRRRTLGYTFGIAVLGALFAALATLGASRRVGSPLLLQLLMTAWAVAPFIALAATCILSAGWSDTARRRFDTATLAIVVISAVIYFYVAFMTSRPPTAAFVLIPPVAWAAMLGLAVLALAGRR